MSLVYIIYFLILYFLFKIIEIISNYFLISRELYKIPSLPLTVSIKLNIGNYLLGVPFVTNIRNYLLEPLEETGIVKVICKFFIDTGTHVALINFIYPSYSITIYYGRDG